MAGAGESDELVTEMHPKKVPLRTVGKAGTRARLLGQGQFGSVFHAEFQHQDSSHWLDAAVKVPRLPSTGEFASDIHLDPAFRAELSLMKLLSKRPHPNVLNLHAAILDRSGESASSLGLRPSGEHHASAMTTGGRVGKEPALYIVTELCDQGDLFDRVADPSTSYTERDAALLFRQVLHGVQHIHAAGFVHRDLKPENVFLKAPGATRTHAPPGGPAADSHGVAPLEVVVGDLGLAATPTAAGASEGAFEGTLPYAAPEQLTPPRFSFGYKSDVWAAGCILYILLCGRPPFFAQGAGTRAEQEERMVEQIRGGRVDYGGRLFAGVSPEAVALLQGMLAVDPRDRLSVGGALEHPWFECTVPDVLEAERAVREAEAEAEDGGAGAIARVASARSSVSAAASGASASAALDGAQRRLRKFNARRRFRGAMMAALAMGRSSGGLLTTGSSGRSGRGAAGPGGGAASGGGEGAESGAGAGSDAAGSWGGGSVGRGGGGPRSRSALSGMSLSVPGAGVGAGGDGAGAACGLVLQVRELLRERVPSPVPAGARATPDEEVLRSLCEGARLRWVDLLGGRIALSHLREGLADPLEAGAAGDDAGGSPTPGGGRRRHATCSRVDLPRLQRALEASLGTAVRKLLRKGHRRASSLALDPGEAVRSASAESGGKGGGFAPSPPAARAHRRSTSSAVDIPVPWLEAAVWRDVLQALAGGGGSREGARGADGVVDGAVILSSLVLAQSSLPGVGGAKGGGGAGGDTAEAGDGKLGEEASLGRLFGQEPAWSLLFYASDLDRDGSVAQSEITRGMEGLGQGWVDLVRAVAQEAAEEAARVHEAEDDEGGEHEERGFHRRLEEGAGGVLAALDADSDGEISHEEWMAAVGFRADRRLKESPARRAAGGEGRDVSASSEVGDVGEIGGALEAGGAGVSSAGEEQLGEGEGKEDD